MRFRYLLSVVGVLIAGLFLVSATLGAQLVTRPSLIQMDWQLRTVRPSGQPVIPIFEGWYANEDGTYDLCFGFFNLNREEALDIPVGPDNFIEPARFNGLQPTHFSPLGAKESAFISPPNTGGNTLNPITREYCVFTVNVPEDVGSERVWWNLLRDGHTYRVPGHITARPWRVDNLMNSVGTALMEFENEAPITGGLRAPVVRFIEPSGPEGRGKGGRLTAGPVTAQVGDPLPLTISVADPAGEAILLEDFNDQEGIFARQSTKWTKFAGPAGMVSFSPRTSRFEVGGDATELRTEVVFSEPGDYVLLVQVLSGGFSNQCCWTNAYVNVTVTP